MADFATVQVAQGALRGRRTTSKTGVPYFSFQGIPYGKAPLRFEVAQPAAPWAGERDALTTGPVCRQLDLFTTEFVGEEDCLHLNVYTPELPSSSNAPRPVMVWIHGGGFVMWSGNADIFGPDFLVDAGVVLVTINYRLNVLGFLYLEDAVVPGNLGLKDQVLALKWVQQNIAQFGGDPGNVTIFGESAGGASVHYLMLSPMSEGLFHRAIAQSGSSLNPWAFSKKPREMAFRLGALLGHTGEDSQALVDFLRSVDAETLVKTALEALSDSDKKRLMVFAFVPTLEVAVDGVERFLPASPEELLEQGRYHSVPFVTGVTSAECAFLLKFAGIETPDMIQRFNDDFEQIVLPDVRLPEDREVAAKIKEFFFQGKPLTKDNMQGFVDLYTDLHFSEGVLTALHKMARHPKAPLFLYCFSYDGKMLSFKNSFFKAEFPGASHADDLGYLFRMAAVDIDLAPEASDAITRSRMVHMWTNFAKTGNPTPEGSSLVPVTWPEYSAVKPNHLNIGETLVTGQDLFKERMAFWSELYCKP